MANDQRLIRIKSSLGENKFQLREMEVTEQLGQPFSIELTADSEDLDINYKDILGDHLSVELDIADSEHRYFDGIVASFAYVGLTEFHASYRITLRPWLWLLTRHIQCKIFQGKTVPDIIKDVFRAAKFDDFEDKLRRSDYVSLDYCVQYRESDFAFVSRLMEDEGMYYFFKHSASGHQLVVANTPQSHPELPGSSKIIYESVAGGQRDEDRIQTWEKFQEVRSGKCTLWDYCFEMPL